MQSANNEPVDEMLRQASWLETEGCNVSWFHNIQPAVDCVLKYVYANDLMNMEFNFSFLKYFELNASCHVLSCIVCVFIYKICNWGNLHVY